MDNRISVAIATCNGAKYIEAQLASIFSQQLKPAEIIVCDDASDDGTAGILKRYEQEGLLKLYLNEERLGITGNFKKAVSLCNKDNYVALCDQDDYWLPDKLQKGAAALHALDDGATPSLVYADLSLTDDNLVIKAKSFWEVLKIKPAKEHLRSLLFGNFITGCTIMMNPAMSKLFCNMPVKGVTMHDAWLGLIAFTFGKAVFIDEPLVLYRQHGENVTFETNKESSLVTKVQQAVSQMANNKEYLAKEMQMAHTFSTTYHDRLNTEQKEILKQFTGLEKAFFMKKKLHSILARAYRINRIS